MNTKEQAIAMASDIVLKYPQAKTVTEAYDLAVANNMFTNKDQALAVWGRLMRLLPQAVA